MLFNSLRFAEFLPIVFILYWFVTSKNLKLQNILLLVSSYFFYSCWDYRFLLLLIFSTFIDYYSGIKIGTAKTKQAKKFWFWLSISLNLGFLGIFKYYNFFATSFASAVSHFGFSPSVSTLNIVLPIGISFYTFHGLSYIIDTYKNRIEAERSFIDYAVFVSFFPLLVAGPIERATHLLPQIKKKRDFEYCKAVDGLKQILWGLFKKIVIADNCAKYANLIFGNSDNYAGSTHVLGAIFFAFQIYCDFSGYSDIALGAARLFGIELLRNFAFPYFSRDIAEFWRRWHISLSGWFKDYLYIPLGGSKGALWMKVRNTFIIFLVSGLWHGANWTFIIWGVLNAVYFLPLMLLKTNRANVESVASGKRLPTLSELLQMLLTFALVVFAWIFFRAETVTDAIGFISKIFSTSLFTVPQLVPKLLLFVIALFILIEWTGREQKYALAELAIKWPKVMRYGFYYTLIIALFFMAGNEQKFIYFQF